MGNYARRGQDWHVPILTAPSIVGHYVSLERLIMQHRERYYETLKLSSEGCHEGEQDPWPYITWLLYMLLMAYREFERWAGQGTSARGAKADLVRQAVQAQQREFRVSDIERACPGVGRHWIRALLADLKQEGKATCRGRGRGTWWQVVGR
jgi:hypothetical protein